MQFHTQRMLIFLEMDFFFQRGIPHLSTRVAVLSTGMQMLSPWGISTAAGTQLHAPKRETPGCRVNVSPPPFLSPFHQLMFLEISVAKPANMN